MTRIKAVAVLLSFLLSAQAAVAGERVRIQTTTGKSRLIGTIEAADDQDITLDLVTSKSRVTVARDTIQTLEVSHGKRSRLRGAALGLAVGALVLGVGVYARWRGSCSGAASGLIGTPSPDSQPCLFSSNRDGTAAAGAIAGALLGGVIGVAAPRGERWEHTSPMTFRLSAAPTPGKGVYPQLRVAF